MDVCEEYGIASTWEILTEEMLQFLVRNISNSG